jgi:hypothetical protein
VYLFWWKEAQLWVIFPPRQNKTEDVSGQSALKTLVNGLGKKILKFLRPNHHCTPPKNPYRLLCLNKQIP